MKTKRRFDIIFSIIGLVVLVLIFPLIAIAIKLDSEGPVIYTQYRVGMNARKSLPRKIRLAQCRRRVFSPGKLFKMYKFRTMVTNSEPSGEQWSRKNDPRVTRVGKFLRASHIDELPQLWNILIGEMSLVGPRPERPTITHFLRKKVDGYDNRLKVLPGIAGRAQLHNGYDTSIDSVKRKVQYDMDYINNASVFEDVRILFGTFAKIVWRN